MDVKRIGIKLKSLGGVEKVFSLVMNQFLESIIRILVPEGILEYFELSKIVEGLTGFIFAEKRKEWRDQAEKLGGS
jgi:hypothetical protein